MEMHEFERAWKDLGSRLSGNELAVQNMRRAGSIDRIRHRLRLVFAGQWVQLVVGLLITFWAGQYWFGHWTELHRLVYGAAVHLFGISMLVAAIAQLVRLGQFDFQQPVVEMQRQLLAVRHLRVRCERWLIAAAFGVFGPILPMLIFHGLGIDLPWYQRPEAIASNVAAGVLLALGAAWFMRRRGQAFERDAAGHSLREAQAELDELTGTEG